MEGQLVMDVQLLDLAAGRAVWMGGAEGSFNVRPRATSLQLQFLTDGLVVGLMFVGWQDGNKLKIRDHANPNKADQSARIKTDPLRAISPSSSF